MEHKMKKIFVILLLFTQSLFAQEDLGYLQCLSDIQQSLPAFKHFEERPTSNTKMILLPESEDIYFITKERQAYKSTAAKQFFLESLSKSTGLSSPFIIDLVNEKYTTSYQISLQIETKTELEDRKSILLDKINKLQQIHQESFITDIYLEPVFLVRNAPELAIEKIELKSMPSQALDFYLSLVIDKFLVSFEIDNKNYHANPSSNFAPNLANYLNLINSCSDTRISENFQGKINQLRQKLYEMATELFAIPSKFFKAKRERKLKQAQFSANTSSSKIQFDYLKKEFQCIKDLKNEEHSFWHGEMGMAISYMDLDQAYIVLNNYGSDDFFIFIEDKSPFSFKLNKNWGYEDSNNSQYRYYFRRFYSQESKLAFDFNITEQKNGDDYFSGFKYMARAFSGNRVHYEVDLKPMDETRAKNELGKSLSKYLNARSSEKYKTPQSCEAYL